MSTGAKPIYERGGKDWGTVNLGQMRVTGRTAAVVLGALLWLVPALVATGSDGLVALITNVVFVALLLLIATATRSVTIQRVAAMFFFGGFMVLGILLVGMVSDPTGSGADVVIPLFEELLKLAPVVFVLWRWRAGRTWSLGATDILLLAAACGAGFAVVEDAHIRDAIGWAGSLPLLPAAEVRGGGGVIVGHAIWSALAGAGIGLALMFRSRLAIAIPLAVVGFLVALLDHIGLNSGSTILGTLTADGYVSLVLFLGGLGACIALDLRILTGVRRRPPELTSPPQARDLAGFRATWAFVLEKRALLFAAHQHAWAREAARARPRDVTLALAGAVYARHHGGPQASPGA